jgi:Family of unknown function (DUF5989)
MTSEIWVSRRFEVIDLAGQKEIFMRRLGYVGSMLGQIWDFAKHNKVYWIVPFVLILGLVILLVVTSQATAPFIYTLF